LSLALLGQALHWQIDRFIARSSTPLSCRAPSRPISFYQNFFNSHNLLKSNISCKPQVYFGEFQCCFQSTFR
jgi:hypothetical protein